MRYSSDVTALVTNQTPRSLCYDPVVSSLSLSINIIVSMYHFHHIAPESHAFIGRSSNTVIAPAPIYSKLFSILSLPLPTNDFIPLSTPAIARTMT